MYNIFMWFSPRLTLDHAIIDASINFGLKNETHPCKDDVKYYDKVS